MCLFTYVSPRYVLKLGRIRCLVPMGSGVRKVVLVGLTAPISERFHLEYLLMVVHPVLRVPQPRKVASMAEIRVDSIREQHDI